MGASLCEAGDGRVGRFFINIIENDGCALCGQLSCDLKADADGGTGDDGNFVALCGCVWVCSVLLRHGGFDFTKLI